MAAARPFLPTDLLALLARDGRGSHNEAWPRERVAGDAAPSLGAALEPVLALTGQRVWTSVRRGRLQGLVAARRRGGREAWELDRLVDMTPSRAAAGELLVEAMSAAASQGVEKVFLRLDAASALLPAVQAAGFLAYDRETLLVRPPTAAPTTLVDIGLRPCVPSDSYLAFRLYNAGVPQAVRRYEAATYNEWLAAQERHWRRFGLQLVVEGARGGLTALVSAARLPTGVAVDLLLAPEATEHAAALVDAAVAAVGGGGRFVHVLLRQEAAWTSRLTDAGFEPRREFVSLLQRTTRTVPLPKHLPAVAKTALGV